VVRIANRGQNFRPPLTEALRSLAMLRSWDARNGRFVVTAFIYHSPAMHVGYSTGALKHQKQRDIRDDYVALGDECANPQVTAALLAAP
jgi:hypothetical protein